MAYFDAEFEGDFEATAGSEYDPADETDFSSSEDEIPAPTQIVDAGDHEASTSSKKNSNPQSMAWHSSGDPRLEKPHAFAGNSGVQIPFAENATVLDIFEAFLPDNFVQKIVEYTNIYAADQLSRPNLPSKSRIKLWRDTEVIEIYQFLGIIFLMGLDRKPSLKHYFSADEMFFNSLIRKVMSGRRFHLLLSCLHFSDNRVLEPSDRIQKIRLIVDHFRQVFPSIYVPGENICVDESVMLWKGRLGFRQYIKSKRARFGIKSYEICESTTGLRESGVHIKFVTNTTKESKRILLERLDKIGFNIQAEEIFTSLTAARCLLECLKVSPLLMIDDKAVEEFKGIPVENPNAVLVGLAPDKFDYATMNHAFRLLLNGAPLIAIHKGRYYKRKDGLALGPGPFVEALEFSTSQKAQVVGKPAAAFFLAAVQEIGCQPSQCIMIGDDVRDDIEGAQNCGMLGILVRTGKYRVGDEKTIQTPPHFVADDFAAAVNYILSVHV